MSSNLDKQSYYMVIPAEVWGSTELTPNAKILFGHIQVLANKEKYCFAGNKALAKIMDVSEKTIKQYLKELDDLDFISRIPDYIEGTQEIKERRIYINVGITGGTKTSPHVKSKARPQAQKLPFGGGTKTSPVNTKRDLNTINPSSHECESDGGIFKPDIMFNEPSVDDLVRKHEEDTIAKEINWKLLESLWISTESYTDYLKKIWMLVSLEKQEEIISFVKENKNIFSTGNIWKKNFLKDNKLSMEWLKAEIEKKKKLSGPPKPGHGLTDFNL